MTDNLLALRERFTVWEASEILSKSNRTAACALMCEAIAGGKLKTLQLFTHGIYDADMGTHVEGGAVDQMHTVLERVEFERWRDSMGKKEKQPPAAPEQSATDAVESNRPIGSTQPKLNEQQRLEIIELFKRHRQSVASIARQFEVSRRTIDQVLIKAGVSNSKPRK